MPVKIEHGSDPVGDRYHYDFRQCSYAKGWAQLDTRQDASYYGNWVNPTTRQLFCYCEGDTTLTTCDTDEEFVKEVRSTVAWHDERGLGPARIDALWPPGNPIQKAFEALGLGDLLH